MDKKTAMDFMDTITPKNWHVFSGDMGEHSNTPNSLNIWVSFYTIENWPDEDADTMGRVRGGMSVIDSRAGIKLDLNMDWLDEAVLVHELAHIAVTRRQLQKMGRENIPEYGLISQDVEGESMHGPLFQKAYLRMILRAESICGKEVTKLCWDNLKFYEETEL